MSDSIHPKGIRDLVWGDCRLDPTTWLILACGPSARGFELPKGIPSIGVTDCERHVLGDAPQMLMVSDRPVRFHERAGADTVLPFVRVSAIAATRAPFFLVPNDVRAQEWERIRVAVGNTRSKSCHYEFGEDAGTDPFENGFRLHYSKTTVYPAVLMAEYMGAKTIGIIGLDAKDHPNLNWRLDLIDAHFGRLTEALLHRGVRLVNLSPSSAITSIPRCTMEDLQNNAPIR